MIAAGQGEASHDDMRDWLKTHMHYRKRSHGHCTCFVLLYQLHLVIYDVIYRNLDDEKTEGKEAQTFVYSGSVPNYFREEMGQHSHLKFK